LETLIFAVRDLKEFFCLQRTLGTAFLTPDIINYPGYDFIQTVPSRFTNSSLGFIDRKDKTRGYAGPKAQREPKVPEKQNQAYLQDIGPLDHLGLRVAAAERDKASLELMQLTNCTLDLTVTNPSPASITNVLREPVTGLSILLTSGTRLNSGPNEAGPVEQFVANYGRRVHHLAFETANLEDTCYHLSEDGMRFLVDPHGSKDEGLKRALSLPSLYTLLANEYLYRYQGFTGFYPRSKASIRYFEA
jgi:4-hydroxyphenylpyruvate dioxygenase-like putative hemolysin